jgi:hypothetical protein
MKTRARPNPASYLDFHFDAHCQFTKKARGRRDMPGFKFDVYVNVM